MQELKVTINQLTEEVDEKNSRINILEQLQKQKLPNMYKEIKHVDKERKLVDAVSTSTQTDEVLL